MTAIAIVVALTLLLWLATALRAAIAIAHTPRVDEPPPPADPAPRVAIFVPVRDEIEYLPRLLETLRAQEGVALEVLVYDDQSSDGSAELLDVHARQDPRLRVVHATSGPPAGWCGKPHALVRAVEAYDGDAPLFLFLDADVELQPGAVAALVADLETNGVDLVSPLPTLACDSFWAAVLGPNFASVATLPYPPARVNDPGDPTAFLNGQIVLVRRAAYEQSGGFAAVRDEILEDVALARRMKAQGLRLRVVDAQELAQTHMYNTFLEHVEGWSKNLFPLVGYSRRRAVSLAAFLVTMAWLPLACLGLAILALVQMHLGVAAVALLGYLVPSAVQIGLRARANAAPMFAPFAPIAAAVVATTLLGAAFSRQPVRWKGRSYTSPALRASGRET